MSNTVYISKNKAKKAEVNIGKFEKRNLSLQIPLVNF